MKSCGCAPRFSYKVQCTAVYLAYWNVYYYYYYYYEPKNSSPDSQNHVYCDQFNTVQTNFTEKREIAEMYVQRNTEVHSSFAYIDWVLFVQKRLKGNFKCLFFNPLNCSSTLGTTRLHVRKTYFLLTRPTHVSQNSVHFTIQPQLGGVYNRGNDRLLRGTIWIFKYNSV